VTRAPFAGLAALVATLALAACGGSGADLTIYSGRNEELVGPLLDRFERESGLEVDVRYGDSAELAATIAEEGDNSPADAFFSQDAGALGAIADRLTPLPRPVLAAVPERFRDPDGRWSGVSGRARVIAYATDRVRERELPDSVFELTDERWRGRVGFPPSNASFQAFVSAMRLAVGDGRTREWLEALQANEPKRYENNIQTMEAIARGEIDVGMVNHYYLYELSRENPDFPVANHFPRRGDPGSLVNVAGIGILRTSEQAENAQRFARFLVSRPAQEYFAETTSEYPLIEGVERRGELPPLDEVIGPQVALGELGGQLRSTLQLLDAVGFTT
jgi:iron(III) transport system substrate-binding protein